MANIYRLILISTIFICCNYSHAALMTWNNTTTTNAASAAQAVCAPNNAGYGTFTSFNINPGSPTATYGFQCSIQGSSTWTGGANATTGATGSPSHTITGNCPSGVTTSYVASSVTFDCTIPTCPTGQTYVNGQCQKTEGCQPGLPQKGSIPFPGDPVTVCFSGCEADVVSASNQYYCTGGNLPAGQCTVGTWVQTGNSCTAGTTAASPPPPESNKCAAGTCPGTINGVFTCLACTQNNTTTQTDTSTKTNADGSTSSTTSTTQCQGDACTTTTTTTTTPVGGGTPTIESETKKSDDKKSFCEENPTFSACKEGTFTGSCGSPPACTGDAIQCATARATFETNCTLNPSPSSLSDLGNSVASGTENLIGATLSSAAARDTVDLATSLDTSKFLAAGCPADRVITLANGFNLTLPFNSLCTYLEFLGSIVTAFSLLAASRIVGVT